MSGHWDVYLTHLFNTRLKWRSFTRLTLTWSYQFRVIPSQSLCGWNNTLWCKREWKAEFSRRLWNGPHKSKASVARRYKLKTSAANFTAIVKTSLCSTCITIIIFAGFLALVREILVIATKITISILVRKSRLLTKVVMLASRANAEYCVHPNHRYESSCFVKASHIISYYKTCTKNFHFYPGSAAKACKKPLRYLKKWQYIRWTQKKSTR